MESHLARIAQRNGPLNAVVTLDADGARTRAREADAALARGESWGPLHGVPFTIKVTFRTRGLRTTAGIRGTSRERPVAPAAAPRPQSLRDSHALRHRQ